jgi:hypothetical protein
MNALFCKKTKLHLVALTVLGGGLALSGCGAAFSAKTDPNGPLAPRIAALVDANRHYPRWATAPQDLPSPTQIAANVRSLEGKGAALGGEVSRIDWTLDDAEALAARTRAQVGAVPTSPDSLQTADDIEALAQSLRDRAKAPPPIDRRPIP